MFIRFVNLIPMLMPRPMRRRPPPRHGIMQNAQLMLLNCRIYPGRDKTANTGYIAKAPAYVENV